MGAIRWIWDQLKWVLTEFPQPEYLRGLVNDKIGPHWIYALLFAIIFSETGLLVGFFLPGDSLLFACGVLASQKVIDIFILIILLSIAAILGDAVNYAVGWKMGSRVYDKGRLWFIKHDHLMAAKAFYEKHGGRAIILARFIPLVRTFTPFVAGVARMNYRQFVWYNVTGGIGWVVSVTLVGYMLGSNEWVSKNFEKVIFGIIGVSLLPVFFGMIQHWRERKAKTRIIGAEEAE